MNCIDVAVPLLALVEFQKLVLAGPRGGTLGVVEEHLIADGGVPVLAVCDGVERGSW